LPLVTGSGGGTAGSVTELATGVATDVVGSGATVTLADGAGGRTDTEGEEGAAIGTAVACLERSSSTPPMAAATTKASTPGTSRRLPGVEALDVVGENVALAIGATPGPVCPVSSGGGCTDAARSPSTPSMRLDRLLGARRPERREGPRELRDVRVPLRRLLLQAGVDDVGETGGHVAADLGQRRGRLLQDRRDDLGHGVAGEGQALPEQLVEDDAERPDVGADVDLVGRHHLLGRHVPGRAHDGGGPRDHLVPVGDRDLRDAEVEHLHRGPARRARRQEQVRGLEVPVDHAQRVRLGHRLARLEHEAHALGHGQRAAALEGLREILPLEVLHDHEGHARRQRPHVEHAGHVLAVDANRGARLAQEALHDLGVARDLGQEELERDALVELLVDRRHHHAHAALAEHAVDPVLAGDEVSNAHRAVRG
jgi:hypothetical protein